MVPRTMPTATFRCDVCGFQQPVLLTAHFRLVGKPDIMYPHPVHHNHEMRLIQIEYEAAEVA